MIGGTSANIAYPIPKIKSDYCNKEIEKKNDWVTLWNVHDTDRESSNKIGNQICSDIVPR